MDSLISLLRRGLRMKQSPSTTPPTRGSYENYPGEVAGREPHPPRSRGGRCDDERSRRLSALAVSSEGHRGRACCGGRRSGAYGGGKTSRDSKPKSL